MMKRVINITAAVAMLILVAFGSLSCQRSEMSTSDCKGPIELELLGSVSSVAVASATRATLETLPIGTEVRVEVYTAGTFGTASPALLQSGLYVVTQADGLMYPKTPDERVMLAAGEYDFHVFPLLSSYTAGSDIDVPLGDSFLNYVVLNKAFNVNDRLLSVIFDRLCSRVDIVIKVKENAFIQSLAVNSASKVTLSGLPVKSTVVGTNGYAAASADRSGVVSFDLSRFVSSGTGLSSVLSTETTAQGATIVGATDYAGSTAAPVKIKIDMPLLVNGVSKVLNAELAAGFKTKPGLKYKIEIFIDRDGEPEFNVVVEQWVAGETSITPTVRGGYKVGDYLSGGEIVFWVNPFDKERHYKTMYINPNPAMSYPDAVAYATAMGDGWHIPSLDEGREIVANRIEINESLVKIGLAVIFDNWYWTTAPADAGQMWCIALGGPSSAGNITTMSSRFTARSYSVKEYGSGAEYLDYTTKVANCYIAYPKTVGGDMQPLVFNALSKPRYKYRSGLSTLINTLYVGSNPSTVSLDADLGNDLVYQNGDKLEVVWQTAVGHADGGAMVIKSLDLTSEGYARVVVNGTGNAVVAYKRGSTILWNYHIWATDSDPFVTHATANAGGNVNGTAEGGTQARFMDRNLGALSTTDAQPAAADAPKYFGLLYQYGRTTPFTGQGGSTTLKAYPQLYDKTGNAITMNNIGGFTVQVDIAVSDVTTAIQNPMNWYYTSIGGGNTWYSFGEVSLWSDYGTNKSIYDPCPYGYRVPKNGSWDGFTSQSFTTAIDGGMVAFGTWWPAAGFRWFSKDIVLTQVGALGLYWSSSLISGSMVVAYSFRLLSSGVITLAYQKSSGNSVRCVQEGY